MPLDELEKVVCKLEAVKLSTNTLQNLTTQVDTVNKNRANQANVEGLPTLGRTAVEAKEVTQPNQGQQMTHVATVVPSVKMDYLP